LFYRTRIFLIVAAFSVIFISYYRLPAQNSTQKSAANVHDLKILLSDPPRAEMQADLTIKDGRLLMIGGSVNHLPRGWATFVRNIKITDEKGSPLKLEEFSDEKYKTQWRVGNQFQARASLLRDRPFLCQNQMGRGQRASRFL
jgi:hypothetical protein